MADFGDPYAAMNTNPYLMMLQQQQEAPDWRMALANAAIGLGAGMSHSAANGQGWAGGIGPGLLMANQMMAQQRQHAEQEAMKRWQMGMMAQEYADKHADRELKRKQLGALAGMYAPDGGGVPGGGIQAPQTSPISLGPQSYDTKVAGYEGGTKNGGMVYNELGSGAAGPYQFMPSTWASVAQQHPELNLPATPPMENTPEARAIHDKAHSAFKADNARALQAAGFQPTPDNLYLAHRFGVGGATSVLRADPNQSLAEILPVDWQRQNPDMRGQTAGGFRRLAAERVGGVGVPYEVPPDAKPTPWSLQQGTPSVFDSPNGVSSLDALPQVLQAPVMPQPQATMTPAQYTPPSPPSQAPAPATDAPPSLVLPQRPTLSPVDSARLQSLVMAGQPDKAEAEYNRIHNVQKEMAVKAYEQKYEEWKHRRNKQEEAPDKAQIAANRDVIIDPVTNQPVVNKTAVDAKTAISAAQGTDPSSKITLELAQDAIKRNSDWQKAGAAAGGTIRNLDLFNKLSDQVKSGKFMGSTTDLKTALKSAGVNLESWGIPDNVGPAQAMQMMSQRFALEMRQEMPGPMSDGDRKFMEKGSISIENDPNANKIMSTWLKGNAERSQDRAKFAREYMRSADFKNDPAGLDDYVEQKLAGKDYFDHSVLPSKESTAPPPAQEPVQAVPIPRAAIKHLMMNPKLADEFDAKYGPGAAARTLGGGK